MVTVSIIIPCYNDGKYLAEALGSVKAQTCPDIECIVINDGSTDPLTLQLLEHLPAQGIILLETLPGRKGPSAARNTGIAAAKGEFILPLDADDRIASSYVAKALRCMRENPSVGICYCKASLFGLKRGEWRLPSYSWEGILADNMIFATAMFRKQDWETLGGYDESLIVGSEDHAFWLRLIALGREVVRIEEELFHYRVKPHSRTARMVESNQEERALEEVFHSCEPIYSQNALLLLKNLRRLQKEKAAWTCLLSWRFFAPIMRIEWLLRQKVKKVLGRA